MNTATLVDIIDPRRTPLFMVQCVSRAVPWIYVIIIISSASFGLVSNLDLRISLPIMHFLISFSVPRGPFVRNVCWLLLNDTVYLAVCVFCVVPMDIFTADFWRCFFGECVCCVTFRYCAYCLCVSDGSMDPIFS